MKRKVRLVLIGFTCLLWLAPEASRAQDHYTYTLSALGGLGGAIGDGGEGIGNNSFSIGVSLLREDRVHVGVRLGQIDFDEEELIGDFTETTLNYLVAGGEYRFLESFYESGLFLGLGAYELEGEDVAGEIESEGGAGLVIGATGEFEINRRVGVIVEILGHVTTLDQHTAFATGQVGLAVHF